MLSAATGGVTTENVREEAVSRRASQKLALEYSKSYFHFIFSNVTSNYFFFILKRHREAGRQRSPIGSFSKSLH